MYCTIRRILPFERTNYLHPINCFQSDFIKMLYCLCRLLHLWVSADWLCVWVLMCSCAHFRKSHCNSFKQNLEGSSSSSSLSCWRKRLKKRFLSPLCACGRRYVRKLVGGLRLCSCVCHIILVLRFVPVPHDISRKWSSQLLLCELSHLEPHSQQHSLNGNE